MRGHCKILLHDTEKKTYKKIEGDNLVTNAYIDRLNYLICSGYSASNFLPLAEKTLGGMMMFDGALTESVNNIQFPAEAHIVGYADRGADTNNRMRGTFNALESGPTANGYTLTWDFSTSQCNDTIGSVALTGADIANLEIGLPAGLREEYYGEFSPSTWRDAIYHDGEYAYRLVWDNSTVTVQRWRVPCGNVKVSTQPNYADNWEDIRTITADGTKLDYYYYSPTGGYIVGLTHTEVNSSGVFTHTITYEKFYPSDWSYSGRESHVLDGITDHGLSLFGWSGDYIYFAFWAIVYRVNPANLADVRSFTFDEKYRNVSPARTFTNGIMGLWVYDTSIVSTSDYPHWQWAFWYPDNHVTYGTYKLTSMTDYHQNEAHSDALYPVRNQCQTGYLGTIFNLPSPVTKTAATTMKVIYTLTDV